MSTCSSDLNAVKSGKILDGYVRIHSSKHNQHIPIDIIQICFNYYHDQIEIFRYYNPSNYKLSDDHKTAQSINIFESSTIYGNICIPSCSKSIHKWKFELIEGYYFGIGIDETTHSRKDSGTFNWCP